jgi:hypothetical protein
LGCTKILIGTDNIFILLYIIAIVYNAESGMSEPDDFVGLSKSPLSKVKKVHPSLLQARRSVLEFNPSHFYPPERKGRL